MNTHLSMTKLKEERIRQGMTQQTLGYRAKVTASDVSKIENNRMLPYPGQAKRIARVLGLEENELQQPAGEAIEAAG